MGSNSSKNHTPMGYVPTEDVIRLMWSPITRDKTRIGRCPLTDDTWMRLSPPLVTGGLFLCSTELVGPRPALTRVRIDHHLARRIPTRAATYVRVHQGRPVIGSGQGLHYSGHSVGGVYMLLCVGVLTKASDHTVPEAQSISYVTRVERRPHDLWATVANP